ncbi:hypothetical protein C8R45DRAFT_402014 [Mycena sanguinolenta]|nr:hypothetical protein C8R45DRAFT_1182957 [Mycena sanguinolenta]KAJ6511157.1 hypothetical protein C8R45DRAFT_402014 [Mycena sanguinolenta]
MRRHPILYFGDGGMTLKAASDGTLYNVYREAFMHQSELVNAVLSLPDSKQHALALHENAKEWFERCRSLKLACTSDDTALELPSQFSSTEIEKFLTFLFLERWSLAPPTLETACAILKLSHFLVVEDGISYSRHHLSTHPDLKAPLRLKLGFDYHFVDWIRGAFDELIGWPFQDISEEDEALMGWTVYRALARAQAEVLDARLNLAVKVPDVNHANWCGNHAYCATQWLNMWTSMDGVVGALIKEELPGAVILEKLPTFDRGSMNSDCHARTCNGLKDQSADELSIFREEEAIVDRHLAALLKVFGVSG